VRWRITSFTTAPTTTCKLTQAWLGRLTDAVGFLAPCHGTLMGFEVVTPVTNTNEAVLCIVNGSQGALAMIDIATFTAGQPHAGNNRPGPHYSTTALFVASSQGDTLAVLLITGSLGTAAANKLTITPS
jgi:hypothetical protein